MSHIHINIGSNKGDRAALIERAVSLIAYRLDPDGECEIRLAPMVESKPWGYESPNTYLNLGIMIVTPKPCDNPEALLDTLLEIEHDISADSHRTADGNYADRFIDIDLIAVDDLVVDTSRLKLPHPRMSQRHFVLAPMAYLDPEWTDPQNGLTSKQLSDNVE